VSTPAETCLSIVVPCFNEEAVLHETYSRLSSLREGLIASGKISSRSEILFVDDGSRDNTWNIIDSWVRGGALVAGVKLSRNCGHQNALLAGLSTARGDAVVTIDADLQDDENAIEPMVDAFHQGHEVVFGVRAKRDTDSVFKRGTARAFYRLMSALGVETVPDHADYRLLSRRAVKHLARFDEVNLFLRGMVPLLGLRSTVVYYDRRLRFAGESKYPLRKMLEFALNGITSFSIAPLRAITLLGFGVSFICVLLSCWVFAVKFMTVNAVPGWASTILPIYFLGGVQLLCAGVLGEYVGKIYMETKRRPRFLIERTAGLHRRVTSSAWKGNKRDGRLQPLERSVSVAKPSSLETRDPAKVQA
jgi:glycosyltransferase involved in cell wall biosynthesis